MLRRNIGYIANLYFGTDYTSIASNALQKVIQIVLGAKNAYCVLLKFL